MSHEYFNSTWQVKEAERLRDCVEGLHNLLELRPETRYQCRYICFNYKTVDKMAPLSLDNDPDNEGI